MSKGYWVVRANVFDKEEYSEYINLATDIIKKFDGKFIVRGGNQTEFEETGFDRTVVVEFFSFGFNSLFLSLLLKSELMRYLPALILFM